MSERYHPSPRRRARLLLLAYACDPQRGGEWSVGWNRALQAARYCDTWVLCEAEYGAAASIEQYAATHGLPPGLKFEPLPMTPWELRIGNNSLTHHLAYHRWQRRAGRRARQLHDEVEFDLVHHVNFNGFREPGYGWQLDVPFIWGPVGGTQNYPRRFLLAGGWKTAVAEGLRSVANRWQLATNRRVRRAARRAHAILAANSTARRDLARWHGVDAEVMSDTGAPAVFEAGSQAAPVAGVNSKHGPSENNSNAADRPLRLLWSGRLLPRKALHLVIAAIARLPKSVAVQLRVVGDGPQRGRWQTLARRFGVSERMEWLGWLSHQEAMRQGEWADAFVFSSLRDTTGAVVHEAMANGLPVVCLDHQGVADMVDDTCGIKIPVTAPEQVAAEMARAFTDLAADGPRRARMSQAARRRANDATWPELGRRMGEVYRRVLAAVGSDATAREVRDDTPDSPAAADIDSQPNSVKVSR